MTERRFRVDAALAEGELVTLPDAVCRHLRVLRLEAGAALVLFDGRGHEADAVLVDASSARLEAVREASEPGRVVVLLGLPKAAKLDEILRGVTEVGATEVRLFVAERSVAQLDEGRAAHKRERWTRILEEAARQSERALVPALAGPSTLAEALAARPASAMLLALDARAGEPIGEALAQAEGELWLVIGPEGGLSEPELELLATAGARRARAELPVMRVETAAVVLTALGVLALRRGTMSD